VPFDRILTEVLNCRPSGPSEYVPGEAKRNESLGAIPKAVNKLHGTSTVQVVPVPSSAM